MTTSPASGLTAFRFEIADSFGGLASVELVGETLVSETWWGSGKPRPQPLAWTAAHEADLRRIFDGARVWRWPSPARSQPGFDGFFFTFDCVWGDWSLSLRSWCCFPPNYKDKAVRPEFPALVSALAGLAGNPGLDSLMTRLLSQYAMEIRP